MPIDVTDPDFDFSGLGGGSGGGNSAASFASALPVVGPIVAGIIGSSGQASANRGMRSLAQRQMEFQEHMSSTAYQRAVRDMEAAGLNPMLAYSQGGASSPQGASAQQLSEAGAGVAAYQQAAAGMASSAQAVRTEAETMSNEQLSKKLDNEIVLLERQGTMTGELGDKLNAEKRDLLVKAAISEANRNPRTMAEVAELKARMVEANLAAKITDSELGEFLRWLDRALDALKWVLPSRGGRYTPR